MTGTDQQKQVVLDCEVLKQFTQLLRHHCSKIKRVRQPQRANELLGSAREATKKHSVATYSVHVSASLHTGVFVGWGSTVQLNEDG